MSYVIADLKEGIAMFFTIDRALAGGMGATCFQSDQSKALHFAREEDARKFADTYYPFLSLTMKPATA